jgi:excisionase family DNA binding protein
MTFPSEKLLSVKDLATFLGVTTAAVYKWIKQGSMPAPYRLGGVSGPLRWDAATINAWLEESK